MKNPKESINYKPTKIEIKSFLQKYEASRNKFNKSCA